MGEKHNMNIYDIEVERIDGEKIRLETYRDKVLVIFNSASKCGFTPQLGELQELFDKYKEKGLVVLGFPCNQFQEQEPGDHQEIREFCEKNYGVTFPMFAKIEVNGPQAHPLFQYLKKEFGFKGFNMEHPLGNVLTELLTKEYGDFASSPDIKWNFTKFVVDRGGQVKARFEPTTEPEAMEPCIVELLS